MRTCAPRSSTTVGEPGGSMAVTSTNAAPVGKTKGEASRSGAAAVRKRTHTRTGPLNGPSATVPDSVTVAPSVQSGDASSGGVDTDVSVSAYHTSAGSPPAFSVTDTNTCRPASERLPDGATAMLSGPASSHRN